MKNSTSWNATSTIGARSSSSTVIGPLRENVKSSSAPSSTGDRSSFQSRDGTTGNPTWLAPSPPFASLA